MGTSSSPIKQVKYKLITIAYITNEKGEILINQRHDERVPLSHLRHDFHGGTVKNEESFEQALYREVKEESGLEIEIMGAAFPWIVRTHWEHADFYMPCDVHCFPARQIGGNLVEQDSKVKKNHWCHLLELGEYDFLPSIDFFLELAGHGDKLSKKHRDNPRIEVFRSQDNGRFQDNGKMKANYSRLPYPVNKLTTQSLDHLYR